MDLNKLKQEAKRSFDELDDWGVGDDWSIEESYVNGYSNGAEPREKRIEELEGKISVLLSCKNCPENKGGYICAKEYEDKCLAQKIQYIKELQEEIKNLKKTYRKQRNKRIDDLQKENAELKEINTHTLSQLNLDNGELITELTKAKNLIELLLSDNRTMKAQFESKEQAIVWFEHIHKAEQFLKE